MTRKPITSPAPVTASAEPDLAQMEAVVTEAATMTAPTISRAVSERNRVQLRINELERERADFADRRTLLRAQFEAADSALSAHEADIDDALALYRGGLSQAAE